MHESARSPASLRAAVVGAGFAGLSGAVELAEAGAEVVVLEARDRVGGRVYSERLAEGAVIERGAEFILPTNTYIRAVVDRLGLELWDKGVRYGRREPVGGPPVSGDGLERALELIERALAADPDAGAQSAERFLADLDLDPGAREYVLARTEISAASDAGSVPAISLLGVAHVDDEPSPGVAGGNQRIATELAGRLGGGIHLSSPVRRIARGSDGGLLVQAERDELEVDVALVAVPARVLDAIEFDPPLSEPIAAAFGSVRYGHAAKLLTPLAGPAEPRAVMSVPERYWSWTGHGADGKHQAAVSAFAGSQRALERLGVEAGPERWLRSLAHLRPELELDADAAVLATWGDDPWARAAYSISPGPETTAAMRELAGPIAFAGEHLGGEFSGLMEGALRSGRDAAHRLLTR